MSLLTSYSGLAPEGWRWPRSPCFCVALAQPEHPQPKDLWWQSSFLQPMVLVTPLRSVLRPSLHFRNIANNFGLFAGL